jgi:TRAP-type mannitol/chloroaromatic compound transport system permease small subunit
VIAAAEFLVRWLDRLTAWVGMAFAWLTVFMVVATFANVMLRYLYGVSFVMLYESVLYAFAMVLTAAAGWALMTDDHVRVDIFYRSATPRTRALIDIGGCLFLLFPVLWLIWTRALPYVERSWKLREGSQEMSGIQGIYLLKTFILVFVVVLAIQGLSLVLKRALALAGRRGT